MSKPKKTNNSLESLSRFLGLCFHGLLLIYFAFLTFGFWRQFTERPTSTKFDRVVDEHLPMPALTLCSPFFKMAEVKADLGFPMHPLMTPKPKKEFDMLVDDLGRAEKDLTMDDLWRWFFTMDEIQRNREASSCLIGGVTCIYPKDFGKSDFHENGTVLKVAVASGVWESRFYADNLAGNINLCHTLYPNVTMDLNRDQGNVVILNFRGGEFGKTTKFDIYLHDPEEMVAPATYKVGNNPVVSLFKDDNKRKVRIIPSKTVTEGYARDACSDAPGYRRVECDITQGWDRRIQDMRQTFGQRMACVLPGIQNSLGLPMCTEEGVTPSEDVLNNSNETLGLLHLISGSHTNPAWNYLDLLKPPIGGRLNRTKCPQRCERFTYRLEYEVFNTESDADMFDNDFFAYFPTAEVELWTETGYYTTSGLMSDVGGVLGLLLGSSVLSVLEIVVNGLGLLGRKCRGTID